MKKLSRIAGLLAATALLFSAMGCSDGGSSGGSGGAGGGGDDPKPAKEFKYIYAKMALDYAGAKKFAEKTFLLSDSSIWFAPREGVTLTDGPVEIDANKQVLGKFEDESGYFDDDYYANYDQNARIKLGHKDNGIALYVGKGVKGKLWIYAKCNTSDEPVISISANGTSISGAVPANALQSGNISAACVNGCEVTADEDGIVLIKATGATKATLNISAIFFKETSRKPTATAPAASLFTPVSTKDGYSITVSDATGLEYSTDNGETWADATDSISLTSFGTVLFRVKGTEEKFASPTTAVEVEEYINDSLTTPEAPAAASFTVTDAIDSADGKIETALTGIEYAIGDSTDYAAIPEGGITGLSAGDVVKVRVAAVDDVNNASSATELTVGQGFNARTAEVTNDVATLGFVGTQATGGKTGDDAVVSCKVEDGKVVITAVKAGTDEVKVTNDEYDSEDDVKKFYNAKITVTVGVGGAVTATVKNPCQIAGPALDAFTVTNLAGEAKGAIETALPGVEYAATSNAETWTAYTSKLENLERGTTYFRYAATESFGASKATAVTVRFDGEIALIAADQTADSTGELEKSITVGTKTFAMKGTPGDSPKNIKIDGGVQRFNLPGTLQTVTKGSDDWTNYIKFTTVNANAKVLVSYYSGTAGRYPVIIPNGNAKASKQKATDCDSVISSTVTTTADNAIKSFTFTLATAGEYLLGSASSGLYITEVTIIE